MLSQIIEKRNDLENKINNFKKADFIIGSIFITDNDHRQDYDVREIFDKEIKVNIKDTPSYFFTYIPIKKDKILVASKPYNEWKNYELYEYAKKAEFGDIIRGVTRSDETIRKGRDITDFKVDNIIINDIKKQWKDIGEIVHVIPYKINIYKKDDFFVKHTDSPEKNLIGTTLIDISDQIDQSFVIENKVWNTRKYNTCSFYSDIEHEVKPVRNNYRITISFKIYSENNIATDNNVNELLKETEGIDKFGILLKHGYSYVDNTVKGVDSVLCKMLNKLGWKYEFIPVLVREKIVKDTCHQYEKIDDDLEGNIKIYAVPEEIIENYPPDKWQEQILQSKIYKEVNSNIPFIMLDKGYKWNYRVKTGVFIGNNHSGIAFNSTYLNKALVVSKNN